VTGFESIEHAAVTDVGVRRSHNQDAYVVMPAGDLDLWQRRGHVFLVADGMGAHAVGELASKLAVDSIPHIYSKYAQEGPVAALRKAFQETNNIIHTRGQQNREFEGMGTTGTALLLRPEGAWIAHVGDSRAYRVRRGIIEQLSFDHSLVWELARRQKVNPNELQGIPSNVIVRSLGPESLVTVDVEGPHPIEAGDAFVLCSDGLSGPVSDREIGAVVSTLPPDEAGRFLVDLANLHGGPDNITAIVVRVAGNQAESDGAASKNGSPSSGWGLPGRHRLTKLMAGTSWPLGALFLGIVLAVGAILLNHAQLPGGFPAFLFASFALIAGLAGLAHQNYRPKSHPAEDVELPRKLQVYRQTPCAIDLPLLHKLARAEAVLKHRIRDHHWDADWETCERHHEQAEQFLSEGELVPSFREYCRATRCLTEVLHRQRGKEESFQPVWDRAQD
jgi:protein phosphatase